MPVYPVGTLILYIQGMIQALIDSFHLYHGLDWAALSCGMTGYYLVTNKNHNGFLLSMCGCICGFSVAMISQQYGFILYNLILISLQTRGFIRWRKEAHLPQAAE